MNRYKIKHRNISIKEKILLLFCKTYIVKDTNKICTAIIKYKILHKKFYILKDEIIYE